MLNFSITGKKVGVSQRIPDLDPSLMIKSKVFSQKTPSAAKGKQAQIQKPKVAAIRQPVVQAKKVEVAKPLPSKKQQKIEVKVEKVETNTTTSTMVDQSPVKQPQSASQDLIGQVIVRYNHYKDPFPTINGVLSYKSIEEKYGFADVFHGDFVPVLRFFKTYEQIAPQTRGRALEFSWKVEQSIEYRLQIQEDEAAQSKRQKKAYKASDNAGLKECPCNKSKRAVVELTEEMKRLDPSEFGSQKHRQLLQQRDLEDILFG